MGSFSQQGNHEFPPLVTPPPVQEQSGTSTALITPITPLLGIRYASRNRDCTSHLPVLVLACCFTLTHHLHTNPVLCCLSALRLGQPVILPLRLHFSAFTFSVISYCNHGSNCFLDCL